MSELRLQAAERAPLGIIGSSGCRRRSQPCNRSAAEGLRQYVQACGPPTAGTLATSADAGNQFLLPTPMVLRYAAAGRGVAASAVQGCQWPLPVASSCGCRGCGPLLLNVGANGDVDGPRPNAGPRRSLNRRAMLDIRPVDSLCAAVCVND